MRRLLAITTVAAALALPTTASANHQQGRHDCFGRAVAAVAGPGLGEVLSMLAHGFRPFGASVISIEARTCEEVLD